MKIVHLEKKSSISRDKNNDRMQISSGERQNRKRLQVGSYTETRVRRDFGCNTRIFSTTLYISKQKLYGGVFFCTRSITTIDGGNIMTSEKRTRRLCLDSVHAFGYIIYYVLFDYRGMYSYVRII